MQYLLIALIVAVLCVFGVSCRKNSVPTGTGVEPAETHSGHFLTREDIERQLEHLAKSPPPKKLAMGAMCYAIAVPSQTVDYICPECGEKTLYSMPDSNEPNAFSQAWNAARALSWELQDCRRLVQQINKVDAKLIESQFCRHCSPDASHPRLGLEVRYNEAVHQTWDVTSYDLVALKAFLEGKKKFKTFNDGEEAVKSCLPRLGELLGVEVRVDDSEQ